VAHKWPFPEISEAYLPGNSGKPLAQISYLILISYFTILLTYFLRGFFWVLPPLRAACSFAALLLEDGVFSMEVLLLRSTALVTILGLLGGGVEASAITSLASSDPGSSLDSSNSITSSSSSDSDEESELGSGVGSLALYRELSRLDEGPGV
jgi:hypothetical protein